MRTLVGIIAILLPAGALANGLCGDLQAGDTVYTWRATAFEGGGKLAEYAPLEVVGNPGERIRGCTGARLLVRRTEGPAAEGQVAVSDLALASVEIDRRGSRLLLGVEASGEIEIRLVREGRLVAKERLSPTLTSMGEGAQYSAALEWLGDKGFARSAQVALARFGYEACGYNNPVLPVVWTGKALVAGPEASNVAEAGVFHFSTRIVFPSDQGGVREGLVLQRQTAAFDERRLAYLPESVEEEFWTFEGDRFVARPGE